MMKDGYKKMTEADRRGFNEPDKNMGDRGLWDPMSIVVLIFVTVGFIFASHLAPEAKPVHIAPVYPPAANVDELNVVVVEQYEGEKPKFPPGFSEYPEDVRKEMSKWRTELRNKDKFSQVQPRIVESWNTPPVSEDECVIGVFLHMKKAGGSSINGFIRDFNEKNNWGLEFKQLRLAQAVRESEKLIKDITDELSPNSRFFLEVHGTQDSSFNITEKIVEPLEKAALEKNPKGCRIVTSTVIRRPLDFYMSNLIDIFQNSMFEQRFYKYNPEEVTWKNGGFRVDGEWHSEESLRKWAPEIRDFESKTLAQYATPKRPHTVVVQDGLTTEDIEDIKRLMLEFDLVGLTECEEPFMLMVASAMGLPLDKADQKSFSDEKRIRNEHGFNPNIQAAELRKTNKAWFNAGLTVMKEIETASKLDRLLWVSAGERFEALTKAWEQSEAGKAFDKKIPELWKPTKSRISSSNPENEDLPICKEREYTDDLPKSFSY